MKAPSIKYWPIIGIVIILAVMAFFLFRGRNRPSEDSSRTEQAFEEGLRLENIHYVENNPEKGIKWVLDANEVSFSKDRQHISFYDFRLKLEPEGSPVIELEGQSGNYNKDSNEIILKGELRGRSDNGYTILTEELHYKQEEGLLTSDKFVKITGPYFSVEGQGLHMDLDRETLGVTSKVTTLIESESFIL